MKNQLAFIAGFLFSIWFTIATYNFATQILPSQRVTFALSIPALPVSPRLAHVYSQQDLDCLHENIFFEARNQSTMGMSMVGIVTIIRSRMPEFPNTICGVVHESHQFSWTSYKHKINHKDKIEENAWKFTQLIAQNLLMNSDGIDETYRNVAYYHTVKIHPKWADSLKREFVVGDHIFYSKDSNETPSFVLR